MKHFLRTNRVTILFAGIYLFTFIVAVYGLQAARQINNALVGVYDQGIVPMRELQLARQEALYFSRAQVDILLEPTVEGKRSFEATAERHGDAVQAAVAALLARDLSPGQRREVELFRTQWNDYVGYAAQVRGLSFKGDDAGALLTLRTESRPRIEAATRTVDQMLDAQVEANLALRTRNEDIAQESYLLAMLLIGLVTLAILALVVLGAYQVGRSVGVLRDMLREAH